MKRRLTFNAALMITSLLTAACACAEPIYRCTDSAGHSVFQQVPCNADSLDSLADTHTSDVFRREESERQARSKAQAERQLVERAEVARIMMLDQEAHAKAAIVDQDKRSAATKEAVTYLQLCVGGDPECTVSSVALALKGMTMASVEGVLGAPREQKIGDTKFYYYPIRLKSGLNTLQVQYEIDRTRVTTGGQVGNVVSEVNY